MRWSQVGCVCCYVSLCALRMSSVCSAPAPEMKPSPTPQSWTAKMERLHFKTRNSGTKVDPNSDRDHFDNDVTKIGVSHVTAVLNRQDLDKRGGGFGRTPNKGRSSLKTTDTNLKAPDSASHGLLYERDQPVNNNTEGQSMPTTIYETNKSTSAIQNVTNRLTENENQTLKSQNTLEKTNITRNVSNQLTENKNQSIISRNNSEIRFVETIITTPSSDVFNTTDGIKSTDNDLPWPTTEHDTIGNVLSNSIPRIPSEFTTEVTPLPPLQSSSYPNMNLSGHENFSTPINETDKQYPTRLIDQIKPKANNTEKTNNLTVKKPHETIGQNLTPETSLSFNTTSTVNYNFSNIYKDLPDITAPGQRVGGDVKKTDYHNKSSTDIFKANSTVTSVVEKNKSGETVGLGKHTLHDFHMPEDISAHEVITTPNNWNDTTLTISLCGERDSVVVSWSLDNNSSDISGFVVSYKMNDREDYDSSRLGKYVRDFTLHSLHLDEDYDICVHVVVNSTTVKTECSHWSESSMKIVVGILAGTIFLIPCIVVIIWILCKDKKMKKKYASYDETEQQQAAQQILMMHDHSEHNHEHCGHGHKNGNEDGKKNHLHQHQPETQACNGKSPQKVSGRTMALMHTPQIHDHGHENCATREEDKDYEKNGPWKKMSLKEAHKRYTDMKSQQAALPKNPATFTSASNQIQQSETLNQVPLDQSPKSLQNEKKITPKAESSQVNPNTPREKNGIHPKAEYTQNFPQTNEKTLLSPDKRPERTLNQTDTSKDSSQMNEDDFSVSAAKDSSDLPNVQIGETVYT